LEVDGTRASCLSMEEKEFANDVVKSFLINGIPLNKLRGPLRGWLAKLAGKRLPNGKDLPAMCIPNLLFEEEELQRIELRDQDLSIVYDATPRQGELMVVVARLVKEDQDKKTARIQHILFYISTLADSLNAASLSAEVSTALSQRQILDRNVPAAAMDRCFTNSASAEEMNAAAGVTNSLQRLTVYCFSHMINNAGEKAEFVLLSYMWGLLQKVFSLSNATKEVFLRVTKKAFPSYSSTRWFSKYDVLEIIAGLFPDLLTVMIEVAQRKIAPENSHKLLNLLLDPIKSRMLKIQLSAYVEALFPLRNLCYYLESDATDLGFVMADKIADFKALLPDGSMMNLPSSKRLILEVTVVIDLF